MKLREIGLLLLLLVLCMALSGCRTRVTVSGNGDKQSETEAGGSIPADVPGTLPDDTGEDTEKNEASPDRTKENPDASRKEYDENAPAEITAGTERTVNGEGDGTGAFAPGEDAGETAAKLNSAAEETALQTVPADEAGQMGVSEDGEEADSAMTYYSVLLAERMGSLFECQRLNLYWETKEDHVTVFKTSPEHALILDAGAYDVSARLLEENLHVDDGWIGRKNPGVIVKVADRSVLGAGVSSANAAKQVYSDLLNREGWPSIDAVRNGRVILLSEELLDAPHLRLAAMLLIAKTANPAGMADVDMDEAIEMLAEEATGVLPTGSFYYTNQGGFP